MQNKKALIVMDFINDLTHEEGKLGKKGHVDFIKENNTIENLNRAIKKARSENFLIIFVKISFAKDYKNQPNTSNLFKKAKENNAFQVNSWGTKFNENILKTNDDIEIIKSRMSPFYGTHLESFLSTNGIKTLFLAGVATDLVVQSAARDAHDKDYDVFILQDCCATNSNKAHDCSLEILKKFVNVISVEDM